MIEIEPVTEKPDNYHKQLREETRKYLTEDEIQTLLDGEDRRISASGTRALENFHLHGVGEVSAQNGPRLYSVRHTMFHIERAIENLPLALKAKCINAMLERWGGYKDTALFMQIELLELAEEEFDEDYSSTIVKLADELSDEESRFDIMEAHGASYDRIEVAN